MDSLNRQITQNVPSYFNNLPVPKTLGGFRDLSFSEWMKLITFAGAIGLFGYITARGVYTLLPESLLRQIPNGRRHKRFWINPDFQKHKQKITDNIEIDIEDISDGKKLSVCRCYKSAKWPLCDGGHKYHNKETGDNVGAANIRLRRRKDAGDNPQR